MLAGTARGWHSAQPCLPLIVMRSQLRANPAMVVEDLDKASPESRNGRLSDTLLLMTDHQTSKAYFDECLLCPANLSAVTWILTVNNAEKIDPLLRSRFTTLEMPRPRPQDLPVIMSNIVADLSDEYGVAVADLPQVPEDVMDEIRRGFERGTLQARQLAGLYRAALVAAARSEREQRQ
jgi:ATP-dependent Lon protease